MFMALRQYHSAARSRTRPCRHEQRQQQSTLGALNGGIGEPTSPKYEINNLPTSIRGSDTAVKGYLGPCPKLKCLMSGMERQ